MDQWIAVLVSGDGRRTLVVQLLADYPSAAASGASEYVESEALGRAADWHVAAVVREKHAHLVLEALQMELD